MSLLLIKMKLDVVSIEVFVTELICTDTVGFKIPANLLTAYVVFRAAILV